MKKLASILLAAALATSLLAVSTGAAEGVIKKGTPVVDGELDGIYTDSLVLEDLGTADNAYGTDWWYTATADVYFLYDDAYLYICAVVEDDDVLTKGESYATGATSRLPGNPYDNDNIEFRLSMDGSEDSTIKVAVDAYGYACYGLAADYNRLDYSAIKYATTYSDTEYIVEVAVPCTKGALNMIDQGKLGFTYQLNDINENGKHVNHTTSFEGEAVKIPVFYALSNEYAKAPEGEEPSVDTTAPVVDTTAPKADTTAPTADTEIDADPTAPSNPDTFDVLTVAGVIAAASGAAFVLASKKH